MAIDALSKASRYLLAPVMTKSTSRELHFEHRSRAAQSGTGVPAPYRSTSLGNVGLDLMPAGPTRHDEAHLRAG